MELAKVQKLFATLFEAGELSWRQYDRLLAETMKVADAAKAQPHSPQQPQPAMCLGCEYWRMPSGGHCMRGEGVEFCFKVGPHAGVR